MYSLPQFMIVLEISSYQTEVGNNAILHGVFFFHPFKNLNLFLKLIHGHDKKKSAFTAIKSILSKKKSPNK